MRLFLRAEVPGKEGPGLRPFMVNRGTGPLKEGERQRETDEEEARKGCQPLLSPAAAWGMGKLDKMTSKVSSC